MEHTPADEASLEASGVFDLVADTAWEREIEGTRVLFGAHRIDDLGPLVSDLHGQRVLLVADPGITAAGHCQRAMASLERAGLQPLLFDTVDENPTDENVAEGVRAASDHAADFLVALGGGSAMDCSKGINFLYSNGGSMADYEGFGRAKKAMLSSVAVPTTAGTGSEAQSYALITASATHRKMACGDAGARFRAVILDPSLTASVPSRTAAASGLDAVAHAVESYVAKNRSAASARLARTAWTTLDQHLASAMESPGDHLEWGAMQIAAFLAGAAIERSMLGAAHACANPLTANHGLTHGVAVALMLPHVVRFNAEAVPELYAELDAARGWRAASRELAGDPGEALACRIEALRTTAGLPSTLREAGLSDGTRSDLTELAELAGKQWTLRFNPRQASTRDLRDLYEMAL